MTASALGVNQQEKRGRKKITGIPPAHFGPQGPLFLVPLARDAVFLLGVLCTHATVATVTSSSHQHGFTAGTVHRAVLGEEKKAPGILPVISSSQEPLFLVSKRGSLHIHSSCLLHSFAAQAVGPTPVDSVVILQVSAFLMLCLQSVYFSGPQLLCSVCTLLLQYVETESQAD